MAAPSFQPLTATLGAELRGVDLRAPLTPQLIALIGAGLVEHGVIFLRDQDIDPVHHLALARAFGTPVAHPAYPSVEGFDVINVLEVSPERPPKIDTWHTDMTFQARPPLGSILRARVIPEHGGDTLWASLFAAYDSLSERMRGYLEGLRAVHSFAHGFRHTLAEPGALQRLRPAIDANPPVRHPVIRTHPVSGRKALFVNRLFTTRIEGVPERESDALLAFLYDHLETPEHTCRFRWTPNAIAFWDNRSTLHRPVNDFWPAHRRLERITIEGDVPR